MENLQLYVKKYGPAVGVYGGLTLAVIGSGVAGWKAANAWREIEEARMDADAALDPQDAAEIVGPAVTNAITKVVPPLAGAATGIAGVVFGYNAVAGRAAAALSLAAAARVKQLTTEEKVRKIKKVRDSGGSKQELQEAIDELEPIPYSDIAILFDDHSPMFRNDLETNLFFIQAQESYMNMLLETRGHVFLNEVYDALGVPRSSAGQLLGWIKNPEKEKQIRFIVSEPDPMGFVVDFSPAKVIYNEI